MIFTKSNRKTKTKFLIKTQTILIGCICLLLAFSPLAALEARVFEPENIITDAELFDKDSLSKASIQHFLERKNSVLARYSQTVEGVAKKASQIIWEVAQLHKISPKFLLATLEKEQGLLHKTHATEKELDWATGYGCYGGQCNSKYQGFFDQVESSAITQNIYFEKASTFGFRIGVTTKTFDGYNLTPQNQATANLFIYTPYVGYSPELGVTKPYGGNRLFWRIWNRYFTKKYYPDGFVLKYGTSYYLVDKNKKRRFASRDIFLADYSESDAISVNKEIFEAYENGPLVEYAKNTLVKNPSTGQLFLLIDYSTRRALVDSSSLAKLSDFSLAVTADEVPTIAMEKLSTYKEGTIISSKSVYPQGKLFKDEAGTIYLVQDSHKYLVDRVVWQKKYKSLEPEITTSTQLEEYFDGPMVRLPDGTFVKNSNKYYIIAASGQRMKIQNTEILSRVFGSSRLTTALAVSDDLLEAHEAGDTLDYIDDTLIDIDTPSTPIKTPIVSGTYNASFTSIEPKGINLIAGEPQTITVSFQNNGSATWQPENVYLKVFDNLEDGSFTQGQKFPLAESQATTGNIGTFYPELVAPNVAGLQQIAFKLYYDKSGVETKIASIGKFISVTSGETSQVVSHNIPIAIRNVWGPTSITLKIKNTSKETTWDAKNTKLKITSRDGTQSSFYDPNDWLDETVAAIPIGTKIVKPGETATFKFTLKGTGLDPQVYTNKIYLELTDINKRVLLDNRSAWMRMMRLDS